MRKLLSTLSVFIRLRKKEAEKRTDEKEATKLDQRNFKKEYWCQNDVIQMMSKKKIY